MNRQQNNGIKINNQSTNNQIFSNQGHAFIFMLLAISLLNNIKGFDYNIVCACGLFYLSSLNPYIYHFLYFYIMVTLMIIADISTIYLLANKVSFLHAIIFPVVQIILKILLLIFEFLHYKNQAKQDENNNNKKINEEKINQKNNAHQYKKIAKKQQYTAASYYNPIRAKHYNQQNIRDFRSNEYQQFDQVQWMNKKY